MKRTTSSQCVEFKPLFNKKKQKANPSPVYYVTTENIADNALLNKPLHGDTWVGVSGLFNLDAAALRGQGRAHEDWDIKNILIFDYSDHVVKFWSDITAILKEEDTPEGFLKAMHLLILTTPEYGCLCPMESLREDIKAGISFLSSQGDYDFIRDIALKGNLNVIQADLTNEKTFSGLSKFLDNRGLTLDTLYISNVPQYLRFAKDTKGQDQLKSNIAKHISPDAYILDSQRYTNQPRVKFPQTMYTARHYQGERRHSARLGNAPL